MSIEVELAKTTIKFDRIFIEASFVDNGDFQEDFSSIYPVINISLESDSGQYATVGGIYKFDSQKIREFASNLKEIELMQESGMEIPESLSKFSTEISDGFYLKAEVVEAAPSSYCGIHFIKDYCKISSYSTGAITSENLRNFADSIDSVYAEAKVRLREYNAK